MNINRVGLVGLGIMGKPMARNLLNAGYAMGLYARNPDALSEFNSDSVVCYSSPTKLAEQCQVIITVVSDTPDVTEVITGSNGILHGASAGSIVIDMSTISPEITRKIAERLEAKNIQMLDAPVSGGEQGAIDGTLSIMVGGKEETFSHALPVLNCLGKNIVHVGNHGAGQVTKACNQILVAQTMSAVAEAFLLAKSSGVDPAKVRKALLGGFANSKILEVHGKRMLDNTYQPGFKAKLHSKDMEIALDSANQNNIDIPGAVLVANYLKKVVENGDGELDSAAIAKVVFGDIN